MIREHHPAFITWEEFLANEQRLAQNSTGEGQRPVREGPGACREQERIGLFDRLRDGRESMLVLHDCSQDGDDGERD